LAAFAGLGELAVAGVEDLLLAAVKFVLGGDVAGGAVKADVVVVSDEIGDDPPRVVEGEGDLDADAVALEGFVPAFDFAVGLGMRMNSLKSLAMNWGPLSEMRRGVTPG
jgi:hypothetical protein